MLLIFVKEGIKKDIVIDIKSDIVRFIMNLKGIKRNILRPFWGEGGTF